jgi:hypothetical protein
MPRPTARSALVTAAGLAALLTLAGAGLVAAQPTPAPQPPQEAAPKPAEEAAPPSSGVPTPAPTPTPPITEKEVEPAAPPPSETPKAPVAPLRRARYDIAVLQALDKVTAESMRFEARVGQPVRYKTLVFTVKACERAAPDEAFDDSIAYVTIDSQPRTAPGGAAIAPKQAFRGWMYASSPGLHGLEHPVYDAWLITCRTTAPLSPPPAPVAAAPRPAAAPVPTAPVPTAPKTAPPASKAAPPSPKPTPAPAPAPETAPTSPAR